MTPSKKNDDQDVFLTPTETYEGNQKSKLMSQSFSTFNVLKSISQNR